MSIKIMVVDDHRLFREGLISLIGRLQGMEVIGEAENGAEALKVLCHLKPDVVLMDLQMPVMGGLEATEQIVKKYKHLKVIMLSMFSEEHYILNAVQKGASSYLHKNAEPEEIFLAINMTMTHGVYFNEMANKALLEHFNRQASATKLVEKELFNETERAVLLCLCREMNNGEIGEELYLSKRTVDAVRLSLFKKTNSKNVVGLAIFAIKNGLLNL